MSSTNTTTNYHLSQYVGTDKPTYLGDYNEDMLKIDTAIKENADDISTNASNITTVSTNATSALNKANANETAIETVSGTATSALNKANTNESDIVELQANANIVTSETKIGTYENEDLYRVIVDYTPSSTTGSTTGGYNLDIPTGLSDRIDHVYNMRSYLYAESGDNRINQPIPILKFADGTLAMNLAGIQHLTDADYIRFTLYKYQITNSWNNIYPTIRTIIEYTKE